MDIKIGTNAKVGILTSLIATFLFLYFLDPIFGFFGTLILAALSRVYSGCIDRIFLQTALGVGPDPGFYVLTIILGFLLGILFGAIGFFIVRLKFIRKVAKKEASIKLKKPRRKLIILIFVIYGISCALNFFLVWSLWFQLKITTSFEQHMRTVAPYLSEQEEEVLWSKWTQMKSKKDYVLIYNSLKKVAEENNVELPPNPVYTMKSL